VAAWCWPGPTVITAWPAQARGAAWARPWAVTAPSVGGVARPVGAHRPVMEEATGGDSRRGLRGMCRARQAVVWLTEKLQHRWGEGEAPGRWCSSQRGCSDLPAVDPEVPVAQVRRGGCEGQVHSAEKYSEAWLTERRRWARS
jgi:hypothetical protein